MDEIIAIRQKKYKDSIRDQQIIIFGKKYAYYFDSNVYKKSARIITNFLIKKYRWNVPTLNNDIEGKYRFRVVLTTHNSYEYTEELRNLYDEDINIHRIVHSSIISECPENKYVCDAVFDIREIFHKRNEPMFINDNVYYLSPKEHIRLEKQYKLIDGNTTDSIKFLQRLDYERSLVKDFKKSMTKPCPMFI
jgi:hypothetical protein